MISQVKIENIMTVCQYTGDNYNEIISMNNGNPIYDDDEYLKSVIIHGKFEDGTDGICNVGDYICIKNNKLFIIPNDVFIYRLQKGLYKYASDQKPDKDMKNIQLVINISEENYKNIKEQVDKRDYPDMQIGRAIADGIPLSKGHGRIGDLDKLIKAMKERNDDNGGEPLNNVDQGYDLAFQHMIEESNACVIIEADKGQKDGNDTTNTGNN